MKIIPIVMATDNNFIFQVGVAISSILQNKKKETRYKFYILSDSDLSSENRAVIDAIYAKYCEDEIHYIDVDKQKVNVTSNIRHISLTTYYRFFLPSLLGEYDKCIFIDGDVLVLNDLQAAYDVDLTDHYIGAVLDCGVQYYSERHREYFEQEQIADIEQYFNAGFLVMNLKKMREDALEDQLFCSIDPKYKMMDQDILNKCCRGKVKYLPLCYNFFSGFYGNSNFLDGKVYSPDELAEAERKPIVIHYASSEKPWVNVQYDKNGMWWKQAEKLSFCVQYGILHENAEMGYKRSNWKNIIKACQQKEHIIVFGATKIGYKVVDWLMQCGFGNIHAICDNDENKQGEFYCGIEIRAIGEVLEQLAGTYEIIVTNQKYFSEIIDQLHSLGVKDGSICVYKNKTWPHYYKIDSVYYREEIEEIYLKKYGTIEGYEEEMEEWLGKVQENREVFLELL